MFTGLIQYIGKVEEQKKHKKGIYLRIGVDKSLFKKLKEGDSIAINGVCQTVEKVDNSIFQVFSVPETLKSTNLRFLKKGFLVNLELPLRPIDYIGGHFVQGHVDCTAPVKNIKKNEKYWDVLIDYRSRNIISKGSVTLDGISLTIQKVTSKGFWVQIIPATLEKTNIMIWSKGYLVNIETDYLVKSVVNDHSK